jgi:hypothetical protein
VDCAAAKTAKLRAMAERMVDDGVVWKWFVGEALYVCVSCNVPRVFWNALTTRGSTGRERCRYYKIVVSGTVSDRLERAWTERRNLHESERVDRVQAGEAGKIRKRL